MAPKYKLTYFDIRGLGEPIRFIFYYGGIEFEDNRIGFEDWPKIKSNYPNGKLPVLEIDGTTYYQSSAICRYLGKQIGLAGDNDLDGLLIDAAVDTITDARIAFAQYHFEKDPEQKEKKKETVLKEALPTYLGTLEKQVKENNGFLVKGKLSWADLFLAAIHETLSTMLGTDVLADFPNLKALVDKVYALPSIKSWIEKRPKTAM